MSDTAAAAPAVDPKSIVDDDKKKSNEDKAKNKQSKAEKFAAKQAKQAAAGGGGGGGSGGGNKKKEEKKEQGAGGQGGGSDKEGITVPKSVSSFADWYAQIVTKSDLIDYYDISGCYIFRPYAFSIWEFIQSFFDGEIKKLGVKNAYFPMFISKKHLEKEKDHVEGFAPEVAWVTKAGETELPEQIAIRPTSETIMYPYYSKWIRSHRDLPLKLNQWTNVVRWEFKYPTPFIRTREFLWQEGHSAFATLDEAAKEVLDILNLYERVYQDLLAVPVVKGKKTEVEKFAGGYYTTTVEAFIPVVGRGVQGATSHCLGQNFAKMFNIEYESEKGKKELVWQNSWGLTTRTLGVLIMVHSDNKGLILPPRVAPIQVIVVPIIYKESESIIKAADEVVEELKAAGIRVDIDKRDTKTPAYKFNYWELRGVPIRIEIGPKDVEQSQVTTMRRDQSEDKTKKISVKRSELIESIKNQLNTMQNDMLNRARDHASSHRKRVENWSELMAALDERCTVLAPHCDVTSCEEQIKKRTAEESKAAAAENNASITNTGEEVQKLTGAAKSLCIPFEQPSLAEGTKCVNCGNPAKHYTLFGRSY